MKLRNLEAPPPIRRPLPNPAHTNYLRARDGELDPPLQEGRTVVTHAQLGAPPVVANGVAYTVSRRGTARAVSLDTGRVFWEQRTFPTDSPGRELTAPVSDEWQLYIVTTDGYEFVLGEEEQEYEWSFDTNSHVSAPPIVIDEITYFIANKTNLVALNEGNLRKTGGLGVVESSPSYRDHHLFVVSRAGAVISIGAGKGEVLWRTNTSKIPRLGEAGFSQAPAVAFGHVYAARDDGAVVALDEENGKVAWYAKTGGGLPRSLAVAMVPGTPPMVYVVSTNGVLYAFDARSGKWIWRYDVGAPVAAPTAVVGHTAYVSTANETIGIDVRTHKKTFELPRGPLTPVATEGRQIYMAGDNLLLSLEPTGH